MRVVALALSGLIGLAAWGCGDGGESTDEASPGETHQLEIPEETGSGEALTAQPVEGDFQGVSFDDYAESVDEILALLDEYWAETLPETLGVEYTPPDEIVAYYPEESSPKCGGEPLGPENAFYCSGSNTIAWDEPGLMIPFYEEVGDAAVGIVLGHEWGHLIQNEVAGPEFQHTIEGELNADCLSGTFARALYDEGLLEGGTDLEPGTDLAEAAEGIFLLGDAPGTPWQDPTAHGNGKQRLRALEIGFDGGVQACADELGPGFTDEV